MWVVRVIKEASTNKIVKYHVLDESNMQCYELDNKMMKEFIKQYPGQIINAELDLRYQPRIKDMNPQQKTRYYKKEVHGNYIINYYCIITNCTAGLLDFVAASDKGGTIYGTNNTLADIACKLRIDKIDDLKLFNALVKKEYDKYWVYLFKDNSYRKLSSIVGSNHTDIMGTNWDYRLNRIVHEGLYLDKLKHKKGVYEAKVPDGVCFIEKFYGNVNKLVLPTSLVGLGDSAFEDVDDIEEVVFNSGMELIPDSCFYQSSIKKVRFSGAETVIGPMAFEETDLSGAIVTNAIKVCTKAFSGSKITSIKLLRAQVISNRAFAFCKLLQRVEFEDGLKSIGNSAFEYCSRLKSLEIPSSVEIINNGAFKGCNLLKEVRVPKNAKLGKEAFPKKTKIILY